MLIVMPFCPRCGTKAEPGQLFCENCGHSLQEPADQNILPYTPQAFSPQNPPPLPPVFPQSAPLPKEPIFRLKPAGSKNFLLLGIAITGFIVILIVFLVVPNLFFHEPTSQTPVSKVYTTYSTLVPSQSPAQQIVTTRSSTPMSISPKVTTQFSSGAFSTTEYGSSGRAQFRANRTSGPAPLTVSFYDQTLGSPVKWVWDFGDTSGSSERNPVHIFKTPGKYTVTMNTVISGTQYQNSMNITVTRS